MLPHLRRRAAADTGTKSSLLALAVLIAFSAIPSRPVVAALPAVATIPLVDQTGRSFSLASLGGRTIVVTFVASRCSDACPIANAEFSRLRARLDRESSRAILLTITLDPSYDTPFVFSKTAHAYGARDDGSWRFASGKPSDITTLLAHFSITPRRDRRGIPNVHETFVYVLDDRMKIAKTLLLSTTLAATADEAVREVDSPSRGAARR